jgi:amidase/nitrilase
MAPDPKEEFTLGAAQVAPVYHDKEGTLDRTVEWIERAGREDVDLLVFPETYFPGYPYWRRSTSISRWTDLVVDLSKHSLSVDSDAVELIGEAVDDADLHLVLGTNERSDRVGSETLYNSLFFFDRSGRLVRRHRKLMPTHDERTIWGRGDPSSLATHDTDIGRVGGLICYENHMTLSKAALCAMGEEIHAAAWPGFWEQHGHPGDKTGADSEAAKDTCDIYPAVREYAFETQSFVASCSAYMDDQIPEGFDPDELGFGVGNGGSMLVNPAGIVKAGPIVGEETLLTADFHRDERRATKAYFDAMGHYARWDAVSLQVSDETHDPIRPRDDSSPRPRLSAHRAEELAAEYDISIEAVEAVAEALRE